MSSSNRGTRLRVLVIGGGIGGLCLAHRLQRDGVDVTVYERDESPLSRTQGYRLRISPEGEQALRECLPQRSVRLLAVTSALRRETRITAYNQHLEPQWAPSIEDPRPDSPEKIDAVDRLTFRHVLLGGLECAVRYGKRFVRYEIGADARVTAHFADGSNDVGDVVVAADGTHSRVRAQIRPDTEPHDLGVRTVFSRIPMEKAFAYGLAEIFRDRFTYVNGTDGHHLGLMPMVFRASPATMADLLWPALRLDPVPDYFLGVFNVHRDELAMPDEKFLGLRGAQLRDFVLQRTARWHPGLRTAFAHADPEATFAVPLRASVPVRAWGPGPIVGLGDAVHTMPPAGGVGANAAIRDASSLGRALVDVDHGYKLLAEAVAAYHREMVAYATESIAMSLKIAQWSMKMLDLQPQARLSPRRTS